MTATWRRTRLKNLVEPVQTGVWGSDPTGDDDDIVCVRVADFDRQRFRIESAETIRAVPRRERVGRLLRKGDILLEKSGGTGKNPVGFTVMFDQEYLAVSSNFVGRIRVRAGQFPKFWLYALAASYYTGMTYKFVRQTTGIQNLDQAAFLDVEFGVPELEEQRIVADYLDSETNRIDMLIEEQKRLIEVLRERRAAEVEQAVESVDATGQRFKHYILSVRQGWSPQCYGWPADGVENWAVLKAGAANGGIFRPDENKELPETEVPRTEAVVRSGDLIISRANTQALVGSAAVVEDDYPRLMLCDKLYAFTLNEKILLPRFAAVVLGSRRWRDMIKLEATGASHSMLNVSQADIVNLPMSVPGLDVQRRLLSVLDERIGKIDALLVETERFIELARERRTALITAAVTGQIDVPEMA